MNKAVLLAIPVLAVGIWFAIPKAGPQRYLITGSSTVHPVMQTIAERLHEADPALVIDVETGGSSRGIHDARQREADAGMASRELKPEERAGLDIYPVAYDGVAMIAHASNPITGLTDEQVRAVYTDRVNVWSEIGGGEGEIFVVNKAEGRATLEVFLGFFGLQVSDIHADAVVGDNAQGVRMVATNPQALGYVSVGEAIGAVERGEPIKLLSLDGVVPTIESVADGSFPLRRTLYLFFPDAVDAVGQRILDYLHGPAGEDVVRQHGFVPIARS